MTKPIDLEPAALEVAKRLRSKLCIDSECTFDRGCGCLDAITEALSARSAPEAGKAVVKPLEWIAYSPNIQDAETICGYYELQRRIPLNEGPHWYWRRSGDKLSRAFPTESEAKAAAQKDFETRILSALAFLAPSGAEAVGWQWKTLDTWHTIDKSSVADPEAYARAQASGGQYRPIYAVPQAIAPAEEIGAIERQIYQTIDDLIVNDDGAVPWTHVANARDEVKRIVVAALTSLSARLAAAEQRDHEAFRIGIQHQEASRASEAEASGLRAIISDCAKALGNGAYIAPTCTVEFMRNLPEEIRLAVADLRRKLEEGIEPYFARQIEWSKETFGPALRTHGVIDHIRKELTEIEANPHDLSEWIDVVILAMDGFWRHGGAAADLMPRLLAKQKKNMARSWPDWRTMSEDQAIEHDRSEERALTTDGGPNG